MRRIAIAASLESRDGTLARDARMKNMLRESIDGEAWAVKRPGVANAMDVAGGGVDVQSQGMIYLNNSLYVMAGDILYKAGTALSWSEVIQPQPPDPPNYAFAMEGGPNYPFTYAEMLTPPYNPPFYPNYTHKNFESIAQIVAQMNSNYPGLSPWSYQPATPAASAFVNYPWYIGHVVCPQNDNDGETYVSVIAHNL